MDLSLEGRVAVVTGAGGGLGRSHSLALAARGARVVVNDLGVTPDGAGASQSAADAVVAEIRAAGGQAVADHHSVATREGGEAIIETALEAFNSVDVVVNNAGFLRDRTIAKMDPADFDALIDVHLRGAFHVSQPAFKVMKGKSFGRFVHTTSGSGLFGNFGQANYAAAKSGLLGLSSVIAIEGAASGITSNVIAPAAASRLTGEMPGPVGEAMRPEAVSPLVVYLSSPGCTLTHEVFSVGGGRVARVFLGATPGWFAGKGKDFTAEDVALHLDEIMDTEGFVIPGSVVEEMTPLYTLLNP